MNPLQVLVPSLVKRTRRVPLVALALAGAAAVSCTVGDIAAAPASASATSGPRRVRFTKLGTRT